MVCSAPPTHRADSLAHRQSEWLLNRRPIRVTDSAQSSDCQPSQT